MQIVVNQYMVQVLKEYYTPFINNDLRQGLLNKPDPNIKLKRVK